MVERETVYEFAGGAEAFLALAAALTDRCVADPVLNHAFSHGTDPEHNERLGAYLAEVFGGPAAYTELGGHSAMLEMHAGTGADEDFASRFLACFDQAVDDAGFLTTPNFAVSARLHDLRHERSQGCLARGNEGGAGSLNAPLVVDRTDWRNGRIGELSILSDI